MILEIRGNVTLISSLKEVCDGEGKEAEGGNGNGKAGGEDVRRLQGRGQAWSRQVQGLRRHRQGEELNAQLSPNQLSDSSSPTRTL